MMDVSRQRFQTHGGTYEFVLKDERIPISVRPTKCGPHTNPANTNELRIFRW